MKKILLVLFLVNFKCFSQQFTLQELINLCNANPDKSLDILKTKGFKYIKTDADTDIVFAYAYDDNNPNSLNVYNTSIEPVAKCWFHIYTNSNLRTFNFKSELKANFVKKELLPYKIDTHFYSDYYSIQYVYNNKYVF